MTGVRSVDCHASLAMTGGEGLDCFTLFAMTGRGVAGLLRFARNDGRRGIASLKRGGE